MIRYRYMPSCTQRVQLLSLRVQTGLNPSAGLGMRFPEFDCRAWIHVYTKKDGKVPERYDYSSNEFVERVTIHNDLPTYK